jgi:hypothetical protein
MKKPKLSLGPDGIKGLFVQHIEKMVFGVAVLMVLVFVYLGFSLQSDLQDRTPEQLKVLAANAETHITRPTADEVRKERIPRDGKGGQYEARLEDLGDTSPAPYETRIPWKTPIGAPGSKREDPEMFPPINIETTAMTGPICLKNVDEIENPVAALDNAPSKVRKSRSTRNRRRGGGYGSGSGYPGGEDMGYEGEGEGYGSGSGMPDMGYGSDMGSGSGRSRNRNDKQRKQEGPARRYDASKICGYRPSGVSSGGGYYGMDGGGMGGSGMPGMGSGMPGMDGGGMPGYGGGEGYEGEGYGMGAMTRSTALPLNKTQHVIAVKALAPYRKQADEYETVLGNAVGYNPSRDTPRFIFFQAYRADVTDDPDKELQDSDWKLIMTPTIAADLAKTEEWHGVMQEVADRRYVDRSLTMPAPPMLVRCMDDAMLHTEVPKGMQMRMRRMEEATDEDEEGKEDESKPDMSLPGSGSVAGGRGFPGGSGYPGGSGMPGSGYPGAGYPGGSGGYGYEGEMGGGYGYGGEMGGSGGYGMGYEGEMGGGYGYGGEMEGSGGYGMGYGMGYGGGPSAAAEPVQYKLIRFFDTKAQPGRVYRYRIRLLVEDPNNPNTNPRIGRPSRPPVRRTLSMKVIERLKKQEAAAGDKDPPYYVMTDWSEPSAPVSIPSASRVFASDVNPERFSTGDVKYLTGDVSGNLVPVVWNDALAIDVSKPMKAYRGSVLNTSGTFEVLDPITLEIKLLKKFDLSSGFMVADLLGGEDLPGDRENKVTSIGEVLLIDDQGNFTFHDELDDYERYRRFTLADEVKQATGGFGGGYPGGEGGYPGGEGSYPGGGGYPGAGYPGSGG